MKKVIIASNSIVADFSLEQAPKTGWGEALTEILIDKGIEGENFSYPKTTIYSFFNEGCWQLLKESIAANDIVLIQFDNIQDKKEDTQLFIEYSNTMNRIIEGVKDKQAQAIICTPVERVKIGEELRHTNAELCLCLKKIAETQEVPLFDLNRFTYYVYKQCGIEEAESFFVWGDKDGLENTSSELSDECCLNQKGATMVASYVKKRLKEYLKTTPFFEKYYYGGCMYPEVWDRDIFVKDVQQMSEIGMNFARFGEFGWKDIEPSPGDFDLTLYEDALKIYQEHGIDVCLCIPTPTPPRWLTVSHPETRIVNSDGSVMEHGSRQQCCTNNEDYRFYAYRMTREVAKLANKYDNVVAIQLDNEFKCHVDLCFCDTCQERWYQYLKESYGTIERLNDAWGTSIWSEAYGDFNEVVLPKKTPFLHNSSLQNAFRKFTAETLNEFAHDLCHFVRMETDVPITHNSAFGFNLINDQLFEDLDVVGFDTYPQYTNYPWYTMNLDRWRNVKGTTQEMLLLETCTSHNGHIENYVAPSPLGWVSAEVFSGFAGNLKCFNFWHFRSHRFGVEQPHSAVVTAWGEPDQGFEDVVNGAKLVKKMTPFLNATNYVSADIGFVYSDWSKRAYLIDTSGIYDHRTLVTDYYGSLIREGVNVEMIQESSDFTPYKMLIVPYVRFISDTMLKKLQKFVEQGGKLILGPMTGDRTSELAWPEKNGLDCLGQWLELSKVTQFRMGKIDNEIIYDNTTTTFEGLVTTFSCDDSWDILAKDSKNQVYLAKKKISKGSVVYVGGQPKELVNNSYWKQFIQNEILPFETDREFVSVGEGIMKYRRENHNEIQLYICNMGLEDGKYTLKREATDVLTGKKHLKSDIELERYHYQILSFPKK